MASTSAMWTPSSFQLRLALKIGNFKKSRLGFVRMNTKRQNRELRVLCMVKNAEMRHDWGPWKSSGDFGGWLDSDDGEKSSGPPSENWLKGILIAGAAGIILVAGLTYAALSLSKHNVFGSKLEMVPLVVQQQVSSVSIDEVTSDKGSVDKKARNHTMVRDKSLESYVDDMEIKASSTSMGFPELNETPEGSAEIHMSSMEVQRTHEQRRNDHHDSNQSGSFFESPTGIPAPLAAVQVNPGKVLLPTVVDPVQAQAFAALQALQVIESDAQPGDLCTRCEFARWLVSASNALSRNSISKVYPAMYIENVTELAFNDITPENPDFPFIQGLAEAGLISSRLSHRDLRSDDHQGQFLFFPESPLLRQDLVSWKMALEKQQLPGTNRKMLYQISGFIDIEKINPQAWPALIADLSAGEQGVTALAFGCTRLFQPSKPVTKAQAAVALATGGGSDIVSEELERIEAETMAENAVSAHSALVAQVEDEINASFEKDVLIEREKVDAVEKMAEKAKLEIEKLRAQREEETLTLEKERLAIESELEVLSKLRNELEEQFQSLMSNRAEISCDKERINKLEKQAEEENQEIVRLQHDLEVERKALSMARAWAEDEANRARDQAKALEEARGRWTKHGIKVVVEGDLSEESMAADTWLNVGKQFSVEGTVSRAERLIDQLKVMSNDIRENSRKVIERIIQMILYLVSALRKRAQEVRKKSDELRNKMNSKAEELKTRMCSTAEELKIKSSSKAEELKDATVSTAKETVEGMQKVTGQLGIAVKDVAKRVRDAWRDRVGKLAEKFKTS